MPTYESPFRLGDTVREKLSGVEGRVIGITFWETACAHVGVKRLGLNKEDKPHELQWFDEPNLELVTATTAGDPKAPSITEKPGGPLPSGITNASR